MSDMDLYDECQTCQHIEEAHAIDAPDGEQECNEEGCRCRQYIA